MDDGTNESLTKSLVFQVLFLYTFYRLRALKTLYFYFCNLIKKLENKLKWFLQRILLEIMKKNNTWIIRCLVDDSFVPSSKQTSVSYCKLTDFKWGFCLEGHFSEYVCSLWQIYDGYSSHYDYLKHYMEHLAVSLICSIFVTQARRLIRSKAILYFFSCYGYSSLYVYLQH